MRRLLVCVAVGLMLRVLEAHHSLAGAYDSTNPVTIDGIVSEFQFINPHPFVLVTVKGERANGENGANGAGKAGGAGRAGLAGLAASAVGRNSVEWRLEMDNRVELVQIGMTARTLAKGDRIVARGSRGRENAASMYVMRLDRPADGFWYEQVGSTPHIRK